MYLQTILLCLCVFSVYAEHGHIAQYNSYSFKLPDSGVIPETKVQPHAVYGVPEKIVKPFVKVAPYPAAEPLKPYPAPQPSKPYPAAEPLKALAPVQVNKYEFKIPVTETPKVIRVVKPQEQYGVPKVVPQINTTPLLSKYSFKIPSNQVKVLKPYPASEPLKPYPAPQPSKPYPAAEPLKALAPVQVNKYAFKIPVTDAPPVIRLVKPQEEYGVPKVVPQINTTPLLSKYSFKIPTNQVKDLKPYSAPEPTKPYPAPEPAKPYPAPQLISKYDFKIPTIVTKPKAAYGVPQKIATTEYKVPEVNVAPVVSKYAFKLPENVKSLPNKLYPAPKPYPGPTKALVAPEPIISKYNYKLPITEAPKLAPYPAVKPHAVYGVPQ